MSTKMKRCTRCKTEFPATSEYFHLAKSCNGLRPLCKTCHNATQKERRHKNPEKSRQFYRDWYKENRDYVLAYKRVRYQVFHHEMIQRERLKYALNREVRRTITARCRAKHIEEYNRRAREYARGVDKQARREREREFRRSHPNANRAKGARRRARKMMSEGRYSTADVQAQYKRQHGRCYWCGEKVGKNYHADHVIPLSRGGTNDPSNIVIACPKCNLSKHNKLPHEWEGNGGRMF